MSNGIAILRKDKCNNEVTLQEDSLQDQHGDSDEGRHPDTAPHKVRGQRDLQRHDPQVVDEAGRHIEAVHVIGHQVHHVTGCSFAERGAVQSENLEFKRSVDCTYST